MKKILLIIAMIFGGEYVLAQDTCKVSILEIADTSLYGVIDTLLSIEQRIGTPLKDHDKISINFFEATGRCCRIEYNRDALFGEKILPVDEKFRIRIAYYSGREIVVSGFAPDKRIMAPTGMYKSVPCSWPSENELLTDDYIDDSMMPNFSIMARWNNNEMLIYMIADKDGNVIITP